MKSNERLSVRTKLLKVRHERIKNTEKVTDVQLFRTQSSYSPYFKKKCIRKHALNVHNDYRGISI